MIVVGCHGIGKSHVAAVQASPRVCLAGLCDVNEEEAVSLAVDSGNPPIFTDFEQMLIDARPDIVALGVPTSLHGRMSIRAAEAGVRGIVCEKPMASNLGEAQQMLQAAEEHGAVLLVNHQRRTRHDLTEMRRLAQDGAIGEVEVLRTSSAGDILTDGTHAIDSLRFLAGDADVEWVLGQVHHLWPMRTSTRWNAQSTSQKSPTACAKCSTCMPRARRSHRSAKLQATSCHISIIASKIVRWRVTWNETGRSPFSTTRSNTRSASSRMDPKTLCSASSL